MNRFTFGAAFAVLLSPALAVADESQVTDCTEGCTVITCDAAKCAVNVFDKRVWHIAATYGVPTPNEEPRQARYEWKGSPEDSPAPSTAVVASTDANNQLAKVCNASARSECTIYRISVDGAVELSES